MTIDKAINIIAERTYQNTQDINRKNLQRRHQVVDLFGVPYASSGDAATPAEFYISISPDMEYLERFQFKIIITAFLSSIGGLSAVTGGDTGETTLSGESNIEEELLSGKTYRLTYDNPLIDPASHSHSLDNVQFDATPGITPTPTVSTNWRLLITDENRQNSIDLTPYLMLQYKGRWMHGQGIYPSPRIDHDYDLLQVACDLEAEGNTAGRRLITDCGGKWIQLYSDAPFGVTLINYLKYSHLNR